MDYKIKEKAGLKTNIKDVADILNLIPPEVIEQFAVSTNVDNHVKLLQGSIVFSMLLQMLLTDCRVSQRGARDILVKKSSSLALVPKSDKVIKDHTSITHRLEHINPEYFKKIYEETGKRVSALYQPIELRKLHICAVDSTIVAETCNKLDQGFHIGNKSADGRQRNHVKYSEVFDGLNVLGVEFNDDKTKQAENNSLPEVIKSAAKKDRLHRNLYVIDRGVSSVDKLSELSGQKEGGEGKKEGEEGKKVNFLVRVADSRRTYVVESFPIPNPEIQRGDKIIRILEYDKVQLYKSASVTPEPEVFRHVKAEVCDRVVYPDGTVSETEKRIVNLVTDVEEITAEEMLEAYRMRWMIEVFFKFIKQNLDFSHLISTNANGLKVMMYMTMIAAMLILIYGRVYGMGFRSAKRNFDMDLENMRIAEGIAINGGDPREFLRRKSLRFPDWIQNGLPPLRQDLRDIVTDLDEVRHTNVKKGLFHH